MKKISVKNIVICAISIALTIVMTTTFSVPAIVHNGYINLGDIPIMLTGMLFGPIPGLIVGAIASSLSDILLSYAFYAPISFIVKGLEGFIAGFLMKTKIKKYPLFSPIISGIIMALGYFIGEIFLYGIYGAFLSLPGNLLQGIVCGLIASICFKATKNIINNNEYIDPDKK